MPDLPCKTKAEIETVPATCVTEVEDVDADPENDDPQESECVEVVVDDEADVGDIHGVPDTDADVADGVVTPADETVRSH